MTVHGADSEAAVRPEEVVNAGADVLVCTLGFGVEWGLVHESEAEAVDWVCPEHVGFGADAEAAVLAEDVVNPSVQTLDVGAEGHKWVRTEAVGGCGAEAEAESQSGVDALAPVYFASFDA